MHLKVQEITLSLSLAEGILCLALIQNEIDLIAQEMLTIPFDTLTERNRDEILNLNIKMEDKCDQQ